MNQEVPDPSESPVGRAGSVAWGRRPGRGCEEEWAPRSWKAGCKEALLAAGGGGEWRQGACFEHGSLQDRRCTSKWKCAGRAGFGFVVGSDSGIKHFFGLAMIDPCSLGETLYFLVKLILVSTAHFSYKTLTAPYISDPTS